MCIGRGHFVEVFRKALRLASRLDDSAEAMTLSPALLGILVGQRVPRRFCLMAGHDALE